MSSMKRPSVLANKRSSAKSKAKTKTKTKPKQRAKAKAKPAAPKIVTRTPIEIRMGGYGPATTGFSKGLKQIGDRVEAEFGSDVKVRYVYNIMDLGYKSEDILWLVESGVLSVGYQSSSYLTDRVPELGLVDLPFLFARNEDARGAIDGALGKWLTRKIEDKVDYRILGYFENGFRQISNRLRPVRSAADLSSMSIRVLPSEVQRRTFELLGARPMRMDLTEAIAMVTAGTLDAQENPLANTVTYGVHKFHRFHSITNHFYISRPIFFSRRQFDAWPRRLQQVMRTAVRDAVATQRKVAEQEDTESRNAILAAGCEIVEAAEIDHASFVKAVQPLLDEARKTYGRTAMRLAGQE